MFTKRLFFILSIVVLALPALVAIPFAGAQEGPKPEAVGLRPDAPTYALHGPYWVGARDYVAGDAEHPLELTVWYPALNPAGAEESITYHFDASAKLAFALPDWYEPIILGHALTDAPPDVSGGPYPLVVYSHGFGIYRQSAAYMLEHLASYGFVVIAPDHHEVWDPELSDIVDTTVERPMDVQQTIAYADALTGLGGDLAGLIDMEQLAVAGYSYGGYTALAAAGGRFDTAAFNARCLEAPVGTEFADVFCKYIVPQEAELASLAGLESLPEGVWPSWGDPRVKAVVSIAGSPIIQNEGLHEITAPLLAMVGSVDTGGEGAASSHDIYENVSSSQKALVTFVNGEHMIFNWQCDVLPGFIEIGFFSACSDAVWDLSRTHDLANHFTTAFLLATLKGDQDAAAALAADAVSFPGITYEAQGF
jgi:predicted dienelactone hydrolase